MGRDRDGVYLGGIMGSSGVNMIKIYCLYVCKN